MNYKDTVIKGSSYGLSPTSTETIRLEQAEISFKAGAKEVAKWIHEQGGRLDGHYKEWHKQLEQWGMFNGL
jgi:hypothetical protein